MFEYKGLKIKFSDEVYEPDDDTFLLLENIIASKSDEVLEIGVGCGIVSLFLAKTAKSVTGIDLNPSAVELARKNAKINKIANVKFLKSDLFEKVNTLFNLIVFNPPYVPTEEKTGEPIALAWDGGPDGRKVTDMFLKKAIKHIKPAGRIILVDSSLSKHEKTLEFLKKTGFKAKIIATKKLSFETLYIILATDCISKNPKKCVAFLGPRESNPENQRFSRGLKPNKRA